MSFGALRPDDAARRQSVLCNMVAFSRCGFHPSVPESLFGCQLCHYLHAILHQPILLSPGNVRDPLALGIRQTAARVRVDGRAAPCESAVSIQALISDTMNKMYHVQSVSEEETIAEGNKLSDSLRFEKVGSEVQHRRGQSIEYYDPSSEILYGVGMAPSMRCFDCVQGRNMLAESPEG
jgi:hypothetical protein